MKRVPLNKRGEIHLGDLVRALGGLKAKTPEQSDAISACLGFVIGKAADTKPTPEIYDRNRYPARTRSRPTRPKPSTGFSVPPEPAPPVALPDHVAASRLRELSPRMPPWHEEPDWLNDDYEMLVAGPPPTAVARAPLFSETTSRGIFSAALATERTGEEIDIPRLIEALIRAEGIRNIPRYPASTLDKGCQVLLDYRHSMVPFWDDLTALIGQVSEVLAPEAIEVFRFDADPSEAYRWTPDRKREPWRPRKRPVLVATDLGIQGRGEAITTDPAWHGFIARCKDNGSPLLILIPWPSERWPADLGGYPELVHWSPHTTAAMIKQMIGLGSKIGP